MEKKLFFSLLRRFLRSKDVCQNKTQGCLTNNIDFCLTLGISLRVFFVVLVLACFFPSLSAFFSNKNHFFYFALIIFLFIYWLFVCTDPVSFFSDKTDVDSTHSSSCISHHGSVYHVESAKIKGELHHVKKSENLVIPPDALYGHQHPNNHPQTSYISYEAVFNDSKVSNFDPFR